MYPNEEKETTCVYDYMTKEWTVYSCVPSHITRLCKIAAPFWKEEAQSENGSMRIVAGKWKMGKTQVRFAKLIENSNNMQEEELA